ncbi:MAG: hypothetical protein ACRDYX_02560 [Egibacteraceae bacterium]
MLGLGRVGAHRPCAAVSATSARLNSVWFIASCSSWASRVCSCATDSSRVSSNSRAFSIAIAAGAASSSISR